MKQYRVSESFGNFQNLYWLKGNQATLEYDKFEL